jgi:hypothetical protein
MTMVMMMIITTTMMMLMMMMMIMMMMMMTQILAELNIRRNTTKYLSFRFAKYSAYTFVTSHGVKFIFDLGREA